MGNESWPGVAEQQAAEADLGLVVTTLMRGPVYREQQEKVWRQLGALRNRVSDHVAVTGLVVVIDDAEGYAYLRSRPDDESQPEGPPRLVQRRALSFHVSILLALLRQRLAEFDATNSGTRLILTRDEIVELLRMFLPEGSNDVKLVDAADSLIDKVVGLGFLRRLPNQESTVEVRRILKAFVDAQWLSEFDQRLAAYAESMRSDAIPRSEEEVQA